MEEKYPCPKMTIKQKIENFWYYNKWFVIVGAFFLTLIVISTVQFFFKSDPDISVLYAGPKVLSDQDCDKIMSSCQALISDPNGGEEVEVSMKSFVLNADFSLLDEEKYVDKYTPNYAIDNKEGRVTQAREEFKAFSDEIVSGDCCILLLDEALYADVSKSGALVNLYEIFDELPDSAVDDFGIRLSETKLFREKGFSKLPDDTVVCLKHSSIVSDRTDEENAKLDQINREYFKKLIG